jgi:type VI secretion system protein ImpI
MCSVNIRGRLRDPHYSLKRHMQIQLEIINKNGFERGISTRFAFGDAPAVIGRGKKADWELPDAGRILSSAHCRIAPSKDGFVIAVLSANGIVHNGKPLGQGAEARLADGDRLEIGPYVMLASHWLASEGGGGKTLAPGRGAADWAHEKTIIQREKFPAGAAPRAPMGADKTEPLTRAPVRPAHNRPAAALPAMGVEFVREFAAGAGIDPELLAGRTNLEFAAELGGAMQKAALGMGALARSARELRTLVASRSKDRSGLTGELAREGIGGGEMLTALFAVGGSDFRRAEQSVGDLAENLQAHDAAIFHSMQSALFRLLNEMAPMTIEAGTRSTLLRSKRAQNWDRYVKKWESLSIGRENGMLDVFLEYFREAYDDKMGGH